jgi:hypothetical protein
MSSVAPDWFWFYLLLIVLLRAAAPSSLSNPRPLHTIEFLWSRTDPLSLISYLDRRAPGQQASVWVIPESCFGNEDH